MSGISTDDAYWQFGYHANEKVTTDIFEDGERVSKELSITNLKDADANIDPWEVLSALDDAADAVQYQINGTLYTSDEIQTFIDDGDLDITSSGYVMFNGNQLDTDLVGYEVHSLLIEKLQDEISELNDFISDMQIMENVLKLNDDIKDKGEEFYNHADWDDHPIIDGLMDQMPSFSYSDARKFIKDLNNDYLVWAEVDDYVDATSSSADGDTYYSFASAKISIYNRIHFQTNDYSNAIEVLNNKVKERTTQVEQLGTDLQSNTSQYNSLMEAMSNYYSTYFDAAKSLLTGG
ncbi:hypothetical protein [Pseudoalteromonas spongiae]|uniref:hypothetical protein n=1 Tax=Pseudoalteromonas spongiae TaxID=298657 RepID=UPI00026CDA0D|nr:hypothetical protein [Pseudoalteromonas spongiae]ATD01048.1 hypothetical protein PSPO_b1139 [Pseudoalteromonas spongiae UST010723-006]